MSYTPQYASDYSIPPSPLFPPVPCVSRASIESLNSLYESDAARSSDNESPPRTPTSSQNYYAVSKSRQLFSEEDLFKAFEDRNDPSATLSNMSPRSNGGTKLAHDASDPQSPWKRSIRLRYSDVNMREANSAELHDASVLLSKDMSSYVNSEDESMEEGSRMDKFSPAATSTNLRPKHAEALKSLHDEKNDDERMKDDE